MESSSQMNPQFLSPQQFAKLSGLSLATIHRYLRKGKLAFRQPNGRRGRILIAVNALQINVAEQGKAVADSLPSVTEPAISRSSLQVPPMSGPRPKWQRESPG